MNTEWMNQGKCREVSWDIFFPRHGKGVILAQEICAACPVSQECLEYALENHIDHGVWGGCSERERGRILRRRRSGRTLSASADRHLPRQRVATSQSPIDRPERENTAPEYTSGITETPIMHPGPCRLRGAVYVRLPP